MDIVPALKETGKAVNERGNEVNYAKARDCGVLSWYSKERDIFLCDVPYEMIIDGNWQPYREVKEIRPEKAGELWQYHVSGLFFHTDLGPCNSLQIKGMVDIAIHGKNATRLYPPVEEDVERIEIKEGEWVESDVGFHFPRKMSRPPLRTILEMPKDKP